jgi:transcriptional regulator with XRE-family HTH domain
MMGGMTDSSPARDHLSRLVLERRKETGRTLREVRKASQDETIREDWINRLERGLVGHIPGERRLYALARGLDTPADELKAATALQHLGLGDQNNDTDDWIVIHDPTGRLRQLARILNGASDDEQNRIAGRLDELIADLK